jgi:hypothetical protein
VSPQLRPGVARFQLSPNPVTLLASLLFVLAALVGPGFGLQRALRLGPDPALVLPLGLVGCAGAYALSLLLGQPWVFVVGMLLMNAPNLSSLIGRGPGSGARVTPGPGLRGALWPWLAFVAILAPTQFPWNQVAADGSFALDPMAPYDDSVFHVGLARELTLGLPPQVPGLSGVTLGYHLGQGLVRAAALRFASVPPLDSISRIDPVVLSLGLILLLRSLAFRLGLPPLGVSLAGWSVLFTDFSFVFAGYPGASYWTDLLKGNLLLSLAYVNPVVPGLLLAMGTLLALARYEASEGRAWLGLAALQAAALPHFKVFLGAHLLLGLAVAAALARRERNTLGTLAVLAVPCALMTAALALGQGGAAVGVSLAPFDLVRTTRRSLELAPAHGLSFAVWCALWVFASLGLRWLGLRPAWKALQGPSRAGAALAAMALSAWPIGLAFRIAVRDAPAGQRVVNDSAYLIEQGGPLLWLFAATALAGLSARRGRLAALGLVALALPSTIQFVVHKTTSEPLHRLPAARVRAVAALGAVAPPGDVVLRRPGAGNPPAVVLLANLRVPSERFTLFRSQFASAGFLARRDEQVFRFFTTDDVAEARAIARTLGATYVLQYGPEPLRFDPTGVLEPVFAEDDAQVFRIATTPP